MLFHNLLSQSKIKLLHVRERLLYIYYWRLRKTLDLPRLNKELSPIFVIGANRSGTSVITSILSQHPDLEGIFRGAKNPHYDDVGHSIGFCESEHVWYSLMPNIEYRRQKGHIPFWGLPNYIGKAYRDRAFGDNERRQLTWDLVKYRRTDKAPLLKDQFNSLRIGLIADVFPNARFVLCCRSWQDFISRGLHKWSNDSSDTSMDRPVAGFHWNMVNLIARYDLEIYFPGQYTIVWLDTLHAGSVQACKTFTEITTGLSLKPYEFDLSSIAHNCNQPSSDSFLQNVGITDVPTIVQSERKILKGIHQDLPLK
ncbi:sulfotransferase [Bacteroidota bacterium]